VRRGGNAGRRQAGDSHIHASGSRSGGPRGLTCNLARCCAGAGCRLGARRARRRPARQRRCHRRPRDPGLPAPHARRRGAPIRLRGTGAAPRLSLPWRGGRRRGGGGVNGSGGGGNRSGGGGGFVRNCAQRRRWRGRGRVRTPWHARPGAPTSRFWPAGRRRERCRSTAAAP
jgi:hypothetical protein